MGSVFSHPPLYVSFHVHLLLDVTLPVLGCPGEPLTHRGFVVVVYVLVLLVVEGRGSIGCVLGV